MLYLGSVFLYQTGYDIWSFQAQRRYLACSVLRILGPWQPFLQLVRWWFHTKRGKAKREPKAMAPSSYPELSSAPRVGGTTQAETCHLPPPPHPEPWLRNFAWGRKSGHKTNSSHGNQLCLQQSMEEFKLRALCKTVEVAEKGIGRTMYLRKRQFTLQVFVNQGKWQPRGTFLGEKYQTLRPETVSSGELQFDWFVAVFMLQCIVVNKGTISQQLV